MVNKIKGIDLNQSLIGILWMVITTILFVGVTATVRYLEGEVPAPQAAAIQAQLPPVPAKEASKSTPGEKASTKKKPATRKPRSTKKSD